MKKTSAPRQPSRYSKLIEAVFLRNRKGNATEVNFTRDEFESLAAELGIVLPDNLGDVVYSVRYRTPLPESIRKTAPPSMEWIIEGTGRSEYQFCLVGTGRIIPRAELLATKIPDATPEIINRYALGDEQALLAKVRYNRLIDIFLGIVASSLQSHLRTTVRKGVQIEIDEVYVGIDKHGRHYVVPVQAKGGADKHGVVQTRQDIAWAAKVLPELICRAVSAQFMADNRIAMLELTLDKGEVKIVDEKHYELVPSSEISTAELELYRSSFSPAV